MQVRSPHRPELQILDMNYVIFFYVGFVHFSLHHKVGRG